MKKFFLLGFFFSILLTLPIYSQWQMMNSPLATPDIRKVAYHPDGYIIAITNENEVFRSEINQNNWTKIVVLNQGIQCLMVSPEGYIYAGIEHGYLFSSDIGITWQTKQFYQSSGHIVKDMEFDSDGYIYMVTTTHTSSFPCIFISSDNGNTWMNPINGLPTEYSIMGIEKDSAENIFVIINEILYKSTDNGESWQLVSNIDIYLNDFKIDLNNNIYIIASAISSYKMLKSIDSGNSWFEIYQGPVSKISLDWDNNLYGVIDYDGDMLSYNDTGYTNANLIFSSDGGINWETIGIPELKANDLLRIDDTLFVATSNGLRKSKVLYDEWALCFTYLDKFAGIKDILKLSDNGRIFIGTSRGLMFSENEGENWQTTSLLKSINLLKKDKSGNIYASSDYLYRSSDEGLTWTMPYSITFWPRKEIRNIFINDSDNVLTIQGMNTGFLVARKSSDFGVSWDIVWSDLCICDARSISYSIVENSSGILFVSYLFYKPAPQGYMEAYINKKEPEANWEVLYFDKIAHNMYFFNNELYMATTGYYTPSLGIIKTSDNGNTFISLNNGLSNLNALQLILRNDVFIALTEDGIYRSLDQGNYWMRLDHTGLTANINKIYYDDNRTLYACTNNGIYVFTGELPVELTSFTATTESGKVILNWSTASELNNHGFEIQRKFETNNWITIAFKEGNGTTSEQNNYSYTDDISHLSEPEIYYRLKQVDFDGSFSYSDEVKVLLNPKEYALYQNYPNPLNPSTVIKYSVIEETKVNLTVYDILGSEIKVLVNEKKEPGNYEINFNAETLPSGIYFYRLKTDNFISIKKMIVIK